MTRNIRMLTAMAVAAGMLKLPMIAYADPLPVPPVSLSDLQGSAAKGLPDDLNSAQVSANSVGSNTVTGIISNTGSLNNNSGLTTVLQNTGNNSLFQTSTVMNITIH